MKHNIYLLKSFGPDNEEIYKIGYSTDIQKVLRTHKTHNPFIELVNTWYQEDGVQFEKALRKVVITRQRLFLNERDTTEIQTEWWDEWNTDEALKILNADRWPYIDIPLIVYIECDYDKINRINKMNQTLDHSCPKYKRAMFRYLKPLLVSNTFYPSEELKALIQQAYDTTIGSSNFTLFADRKAKVTDIMGYCPDSKKVQKTIDGEQVEGYLVQFAFTGE